VYDTPDLKLSTEGCVPFLNNPWDEDKSKALFIGAQTPPATDDLNIAFPFQQIFDGPVIEATGKDSTVTNLLPETKHSSLPNE
jgi:hypothetical protein